MTADALGEESDEATGWTAVPPVAASLADVRALLAYVRVAELKACVARFAPRELSDEQAIAWMLGSG